MVFLGNVARLLLGREFIRAFADFGVNRGPRACVGSGWNLLVGRMGSLLRLSRPPLGVGGTPLETGEALFAARVAPLGADEILFGADDTFSWGGWAPVRGWQDPFWVGWSLWKRTGSPLRRTVPFGNGRCPLWSGWDLLQGGPGFFLEQLSPRVRGALRSVGFGVGALGSVRFVWASRYTD